MSLVIREDDFDGVNMHELDSNGEIEIHWNHPDLPREWSFRHAEWRPRRLREDPENKTNWSKLMSITEKFSYGIWKPYPLIVEKFNLQNQTDVSAEDILKKSPWELKALTC